MARLPALVDAIAAHDPRGHATIAHIARRVRDAGLIVSNAPGAGGAAMTYKDAATLLMAACGDTSPLGAVAAAERMRAFVPVPSDDLATMQREDLVEHFDWLRQRTGFADTLEQMIARAPELAEWEARYLEVWAADDSPPSGAVFSMERSVARFKDVNQAFRPGLARAVRVVCYVPGHAAEIHFGHMWRDLEEDDSFHEYYAAPSSTGSAAKTQPVEPEPDGLITVEVGVATLLALHSAVNARPRTRGPGKKSRASAP